MDIRNWPLDKIMQLPDCCFGRRWLIVDARTLVASAVEYSILEAPLSDRFVIWEFNAVKEGAAAQDQNVQLALGEIVPTSDAEFNALELLFPAAFSGDAGAGVLLFMPAGMCVSRMKFPVAANGRKIVLRYKNTHAVNAFIGQVSFVISSMPNEVPDCLFSEHLKNL